ncbi:MAG: acyl-CoA dehydrogenase family protein, partial [Firmicutes bacterium]|nr:acyl-CoA dehydrogenase family protein [Bacillota bacterium]
CLTEDQAGSDIHVLQTRAVRDGSDYVINGSKMFVTNGHIAGFYVVFAETENGMSAFCVPSDTPGIGIGEEEHKLGIRNSSTCEISFQDVRVPDTSLIGREGEGSSIALYCLDRARIFQSRPPATRAPDRGRQPVREGRIRPGIGEGGALPRGSGGRLRELQHLPPRGSRRLRGPLRGGKGRAFRKG